MYEAESALIGAGATLVVAITGGMSAYSAASRGRRRGVYGEAFKAAMSWVELYYRVRRRSVEKGSDDALRQRFHAAQEDINFYTGWIGSESPGMKRSYDRLVRAIKTATEDPIRVAWAEGPKSDGFKPATINVTPDVERFLSDVRRHLAWWQLPRLTVWWRNRPGAEKVEK